MSYSNYQNSRVPGFVRYIADVFRYRHLCWNLVGSDLRSRFRRSRLGILWAIIQPLGYSLLIAWVWGTIFNVPSYMQFAVYVFSGMIVWEYFNTVVNVSMDGLVNAVGYLRQSRIPFLVFQIRVPISGLVIFGAGVIGLFLLLLGVQAVPNSGLTVPAPGLHLLLVPAFFALLVVMFTPLAIIFSVLGAQLRDLKHIMALVLQAMFFLTPVFMERSLLDMGQLGILRYMNPLVPVLDMFRGPVLYGTMWTPLDLTLVAIWSAAFWAVASIVAVGAGRRIVFAL